MSVGAPMLLGVAAPFVLLWLTYFTLLMLVVEMMPSRLNRRAAAFVGSKCNAIFWYCFVSALASAIVGRITPARAKQFEVTEKRGFSADVELRRVAPPPDASGSSPTSPSRAARLSAEDGAPLLPLLPASPRCEPPCVTSPRANDTSGMVGVGTAPCTLAAVADNQAWWTLGTAATPCDVAAGDSTTRDAAAAGGLSAAQEAQLATSPKNSGTCALGAAAPLCAAVAADELARDSSQSDVIFHQLVLSAEMLLLVAGLLRRALAEPDGDADGAGGAGGAGGHHRWRELHDFHRWQQLGLVLVPAAWLLLNTIPNAMALAYAYLPHAHRVQSAAVQYALRAQSALLFFVSLAMVQSAAMHALAEHHRGHMRHGVEGGPHEPDWWHEDRTSLPMYPM